MAVPAVPENSLNPENQQRVKTWCLRHFGRPAGLQSFVPQIDGLRFVAIMAVMLYHLQGYFAAKLPMPPGSGTLLQRILAEGHFGVPLFFALSGFIISRPFFGPKPVALPDYFLRRLTRLEPPYLICLIVIAGIRLIAQQSDFADIWPHLLASMTYTHNLVFGAHSTINGVAWSLEIEWQFYVLAPLLFTVLATNHGRGRHLALWLLMGLGGWAHLIGFDVDPRFGLSLLRYFGFFCAGIWVALLESESTGMVRRHIIYDVLGAGAWFATIAALLSGRAGVIYLPALTAMLVLTGLRGLWISRILGYWPIYGIGGMCYTVYLYHFFVISAVGPPIMRSVVFIESSNLALLVFAILVTPMVIASCAVAYWLIERPFMIWRPRWRKAGTAVRANA